jgi:hypothetical protein
MMSNIPQEWQDHWVVYRCDLEDMSIDPCLMLPEDYREFIPNSSYWVKAHSKTAVLLALKGVPMTNESTPPRNYFYQSY